MYGKKNDFEKGQDNDFVNDFDKDFELEIPLFMQQAQKQENNSVRLNFRFGTDDYKTNTGADAEEDTAIEKKENWFLDVTPVKSENNATEYVYQRRRRPRWRRIIPAFFILAAMIFAAVILFPDKEEIVDLSLLTPQEICIVLDAGHGGRDNGSSAGGILEKDINLALTEQLGQTLQERGYDILLTRESDEFIELEDRAAFANKKRAHLFISLHCNAFEDESANGTEVYYNDEGDSVFLAQSIYNCLLEELNTRGRDYTFGRYEVLSRTNMPGVLIEVGFLSNPNERARLCDADFQLQAVCAIADGIEQFIYGNNE